MDLILTHYKYDENNVPLFDSKLALYEYFENKEDKKIIKNVNFNAEDLLTTTQVVEIDKSLSLFKILNYNYCVVINGKIDETLYYKILRSSQDNGPYIRLELELDAWNSYGYDLIASNPQAMIKRAMLDRYDFTQRQGSYAPFNYKKDSPLFEREIVKNVALRTTDRAKLKFIIDTSSENSTFNNFIYDNILCWKYYFLAQNDSYKYKDNTNTSHQNELSSMAYYNKGITSENSNFVVVCAPIYKSSSSKKIYVNSNQSSDRLWTDNAIYNFILDQQGGFANVKAIKFSFVPPFNIRNLSQNRYVINQNGDMVWLRDDSPMTGFYTPTNNNTICFGLRTRQDIDERILLTSKEFKPKMEHYLSNRLATEPKLYNEDYATYRLYVGGQQIDLPVSKTSFEPKFYYHEILTPEITKAMICFATTKEDIFGNTSNNVFSEETESDFTGLSFSFDFGLWIPKNQLDNFLASNKNYFQINANNATTKGLNAIIGTIGGMVSASRAKEPDVAGTGLSGGFGLAQTGISMITEGVNRELTLDNMRNTPESVANLNSNPLLINSVGKEIGIYIELQQALEHEQKMILDYFSKYGYTYNRFGFISDFIHTRKQYNYIEADINDIDIPVSEDVKKLLIGMFSKGIRFWHNKQLPIQYTYNNYELKWEQ